MRVLVLSHNFSSALTWARDQALQMDEWAYISDRYKVMGLERGTVVVRIPGAEVRSDYDDILHEINIREFNIVQAGSWRR